MGSFQFSLHLTLYVDYILRESGLKADELGSKTKKAQ